MSTAALSTQRTWPILVAVFFGSFVTILSMSTINVAIPVLMEHFHATIDTMQWTITGFMLAMGTIAPIAGYLGERFSFKRLYVAALIGFTLCSLLCALAWNPSVLIAFRIAQGVFCGLVSPATMTIIYQVMPREKQAFAISLWSLSAMLGPAIGPSLSGWLIQSFSWTWLFWMNVPIGLLSTILVARLIPFYRLAVPRKFDLPGLVAVLISSMSLLVAFSKGNSWGWSSDRTIGLLVLGCATLALFIWLELRASVPLLNVRVFRNGRYTLTLLISTIITVSLYSGTFLTPLFLQNVRGVSPLDTGLVLLPASLAMALFMPIVGKLYTRVGPLILMVGGILLIAVGTLAMSWLSVAIASSYIVIWMLVRNVGIALSTMPASNAGMEVIPRELAGHAASMNNWVRNVAGSFSIAIFTALLTARGTAHGKALALAGLHDKQALTNAAFTMSVDDVYLVATIVVLVGLPVCFFVRKRKPDSTPAATTTASAKATVAN